MSQGDLGTLVAAETSGTDLAARLRSWRDAIHTSHSGNARPSYAQPGLIWLDTSGEMWVRKLWTGLVDVALDSINPTTGAVGLLTVEGASVLMKLGAGSGSMVPVPLAQARNELSNKALIRSWTAGQLAGLTQITEDLPTDFFVFELEFETLASAGTAGISLRCGPAGGALHTGSTDYQVMGNNNQPTANNVVPVTQGSGVSIGESNSSGTGIGRVTISDGSNGGFWKGFSEFSSMTGGATSTITKRTFATTVGTGARKRLGIIFGAALIAAGSMRLYGVRT
jgi:hypothetical protein